MFDPGMHGHLWTSSCELLGAPWVNKLHLHLHFTLFIFITSCLISLSNLSKFPCHAGDCRNRTRLLVVWLNLQSRIFLKKGHLAKLVRSNPWKTSSFDNTPKRELSVLCFHQNACSSDPCLNNGTCLSGFTDKRHPCTCPANITWEICEIGKYRACLAKFKHGKGMWEAKILPHSPILLSLLSPPSLCPVFTSASQTSSSLQAWQTNTALFLTVKRISNFCDICFLVSEKSCYACVGGLNADTHEGFAPGARSGSRAPLCVPAIL